MPFIFTIANTPYTGDEVTLELVDGDGVERSYPYTVQAGDSIADVVAMLKVLVNQDIYFVAIDQTTYDLAGLEISQVTTNNYAGFSGTISITYNEANISPAQTLSFSEGRDESERPSFESPLSFHPEWMVSLGTLLVSFKDGELWTHDSATYNNFYGVQYDSSITIVFNELPIQKKTWMGIMEIANSVWDCPQIYTNVMSYGDTPQMSNLIPQEFKLLEGNPTTTIKRDENSRGGKYKGQFMKGNYCVIKFRCPQPSDLKYLSTISVNYINSPLTKV